MKLSFPHRKRLRLPTLDYSQPGAYFITICTHEQTCFLGEVIQENMISNEAGNIIIATWAALPDYYPNIALDAFVVMPNHVHGIVWIQSGDATNNPRVGAGHDPPVEQSSELLIPKREAHEPPLHTEISIPKIIGRFNSGVGGAAHDPPVEQSSELLIPKREAHEPPLHTEISIPKIIGRFKMTSAKQINQYRKTPGCPVWQRGYHDHVIRNEADLYRIRQYITDNPAQWMTDKHHPENN